jgi:hypothetical protein
MKSLAWLFVLLIGVFVCAPARAQSEFIGEHFPYDAFDRLKRSPCILESSRSHRLEF